MSDFGGAQARKAAQNTDEILRRLNKRVNIWGLIIGGVTILGTVFSILSYLKS